MMDLTYFLLVCAFVSLLFIFIPRKWYKQCPINIRLLNTWTCLLSISILATTWLIYGLYELCLVLAGVIVTIINNVV